MNCVGLAETIVPILSKNYGFTLIDGDVNDTRIYALGKICFFVSVSERVIIYMCI